MVKQLPTLLYGQDDYVTAWVAERILDVAGIGFSQGKAIGVVSADSSKLIAGVVYNEYQPEFKTMQLHIAADNPMWARKEIIHDLLAYPFIQLDIFKAWVSIVEDNWKSLKMTDHVGFRTEATLRHHFGKNRHAVIKIMLKPNFKCLYGDMENE